MEEKLGLPENLQSSEKAGFTIMKAFLVDMFGDSYTTRVMQIAKAEFAKVGCFGWVPNDANIVIDVSPMPAPWLGQWGYRLRFCAVMGDGDIRVNQFYVPSSTIPQFRKGDLSAVFN